MTALQSPIRYIFSVLCLTFFFCTIVFAQNKVDLEIKVQAASETARGGEIFTYTVIVSNIGLAKATDVIFIQDDPKIANFVSNVPTKGNCKVDGENLSDNRVLRCSLGDMEVGESIVTVIELKIHDFGGEEVSENLAKTMNAMNESMQGLGINPKTESKGTSIGDVDVSAEEEEENRENNRADVFAEFLPSKNIPPRVRIISPSDRSSFVKPLNKQIEVPIIIKAFDIDGKIERVVVDNNSRFQFIFEDDQMKIKIDGKTYTKEELKEIYKDEESMKSLEVKADLTGKDTYTYIAKKFTYGRNSIRITAFDEGGRSSSQSVEFYVKRDATIEIISPNSQQIFAPNSTITVETTSQINDSQLSQLRIIGTRNDYFYPDTASIPLLKKVSKNGNTFKHQFIWENVPEGIYNLQILLFDGEYPSYYSKEATVIIAEPRVIKITSLKNGQEFESGENIEIKVELRDKKGQIVNDKLELFIDGKSYSENINNSLCGGCEPKSYIWQSPYIEKGIHKIQVIAKYENGTISTQSDIITIKVK